MRHAPSSLQQYVLSWQQQECSGRHWQMKRRMHALLLWQNCKPCVRQHSVMWKQLQQRCSRPGWQLRQLQQRGTSYMPKQ